MSKSLHYGPTLESRLFGDIFSVTGRPTGSPSQEKITDYISGQMIVAHVQQGRAWVPRDLTGEYGVVADLYVGGRVLALLSFEYDTQTAFVYTTSEGGNFGDTVLCEDVSIDRAIVEAEEFIK
jgi:hypothetical protein